MTAYKTHAPLRSHIMPRWNLPETAVSVLSESGGAPLWLTASASKPENVSGLAPWSLKFDAY